MTPAPTRSLLCLAWRRGTRQSLHLMTGKSVDHISSHTIVQATWDTVVLMPVQSANSTSQAACHLMAPRPCPTRTVWFRPRSVVILSRGPLANLRERCYTLSLRLRQTQLSPERPMGAAVRQQALLQLLVRQRRLHSLEQGPPWLFPSGLSLAVLVPWPG
jgi:hypothetical protein